MVFIVELIGVIAGFGIALLACANLVIGLTSFLGATLFRSNKTSLITGLSGAVCAAITTVFFDVEDLAAAFGLWLLIFPLPVYWAVNLWCWKTDSEQRRTDALALRQELAKRMEVKCPDGSKPWGQYLLDAEMARRRSKYDPPPI